MRLVLLRHGTSASANVRPRDLAIPDSDNDLTEAGRREARAAAGRLRHDLGTPLLFCSPLLRACETARIVAAQLQLEFGVWEELAEIFTVSKAVRSETVVDDFRDFWQAYRTNQHPTAEHVRAIALAEDVIRRLIALDAAEVVLVSHGGRIELVLSRLFAMDGVPDRTPDFTLCFGHYHMLDFDSRRSASQRCRILKLNA